MDHTTSPTLGSPATGPAALLQGARAGDSAALGELLASYRPYLLRIAEAELPAWLGGKCDRSDVVQNTTVEALTCFAQFRGDTPAQLQQWMRSILRHQVIRLTREFGAGKRHAGREVPLDRLGHEPPVAAAQPSPSSLAGRLEDDLALRRAMDRLPEQYRQVLVWREWEDLPFAEIGRRLGRSADAARMIWWRAVERLQEELDWADEHPTGRPTTR
jgi:RNA polymerase sigma-70 factor (ECF subfamily)